MEVILFTIGYTRDVIDLILPIQQEEFNIPVDLSMQPDLKDIPAIYQKGKGNFWLAIENNSLVGTIGLIDIGKNEGALKKMFVHPDYRGSKYGTGQLLLQTLLKWSENKQIQVIYLGTRKEFVAAQKFYEKNNFKETSRSSLPDNFPVMETDNKFYSYSSIK
ncbi:MAG: GNAT family N-acetyltransferase [Chitinophagaceae bacterium]|nr:GNAT family N-acetyltransferase [Chitinophagaceae bacterium]